MSLFKIPPNQDLAANWLQQVLLLKGKNLQWNSSEMASSETSVVVIDEHVQLERWGTITSLLDSVNKCVWNSMQLTSISTHNFNSGPSHRFYLLLNSIIMFQIHIPDITILIELYLKIICLSILVYNIYTVYMAAVGCALFYLYYQLLRARFCLQSLLLCGRFWLENQLLRALFCLQTRFCLVCVWNSMQRILTAQGPG